MLALSVCILFGRLRGYPVRVRRERAAVLGTVRHWQGVIGGLLRCRVRMVRARVPVTSDGGGCVYSSM